MSLRDAWERHAADWIRWARAPGHDSYWRFHRDRFLELVPAPGRLTVDVGCGEGRLARDLKALGHHVVAVDASPTMVRAAREEDPALEVLEADAAALPLEDGAADVVVAFMSYQDVDDLVDALREAARVLDPGGALVVAVVHPLNSAAVFPPAEPDGPLVLEESYFERRRSTDRVERDGLEMTFESVHRTLEDYVSPLLETGFALDALREIPDPEHPRWSRYPLFLHLRGTKVQL